MPSNKWPAERERRFVSMLDRGDSYGDIQQAMGLTKGQVVGKAFRLKRCAPVRDTSERDAAIREEYVKWRSLRRLAAKYDLSYQRISKIVGAA